MTEEAAPQTEVQTTSNAESTISEHDKPAVAFDDNVFGSSNQNSQAESAEAVPGWSLAEGVNGSGDAPDWFKSDKYKSVSDQAKAYGDLEKRLGGFTGAPETYDIEISEDFAHLNFDPQNDAFKAIQDKGREAGMSNDMMNEVTNAYLGSMNDSLFPEITEEDHAANRQQVMKDLGPDAANTVNQIKNWSEANLDDDSKAALNEISIDARYIKIMKQMISGASPTKAGQVAQTATSNTFSPDQLREQLGSERYKEDMNFRALVDKRYGEFYQGR